LPRNGERRRNYEVQLQNDGTWTGTETITELNATCISRYALTVTPL
jgi:hypothetical protein